MADFTDAELELIQVFSEGSPLGLIAQLIESEELSEDDIRELERIACLKAEKKRVTLPHVMPTRRMKS